MLKMSGGMIGLLKSPEYILKRIKDGGSISKDEALDLVDANIEWLCRAADGIRKQFCGNVFDLCSIINAKSGRCGEDCKFCAQSAHYHTNAEEYPLLQKDKILTEAKHNSDGGVLRFSLVTSGERLTDKEVDNICDSVKAIKKETRLSVCASLGLLSAEQFARLKTAGVERIHNNLETSRCFFPHVCTTHSYDDKISALEAAREAGMDLCSGGIIGLGETMEDRIDLALTVRKLGVKSVPVNVLNPISGTPFENNPKLSDEEIHRTVAIFRLILPDASIRLAGGRGLMADRGGRCFVSGANAAITGDMLTTSGVTIENDMKILNELGYKPALWSA